MRRRDKKLFSIIPFFSTVLNPPSVCSGVSGLTGRKAWSLFRAICVALWPVLRQTGRDKPPQMAGSFPGLDTSCKRLQCYSVRTVRPSQSATTLVHIDSCGWFSSLLPERVATAPNTTDFFYWTQNIKAQFLWDHRGTRFDHWLAHKLSWSRYPARVFLAVILQTWHGVVYRLRNYATRWKVASSRLD
jgi:hypothetical protein